MHSVDGYIPVQVLQCSHSLRDGFPIVQKWNSPENTAFSGLFVVWVRGFEPLTIGKQAKIDVLKPP